MKTKINFLSYIAQFFLEWKTFQTKFVEEIKTHLLGWVTVFPESYSANEIMWKKCCRAGQATDDNMARAHCMLVN
jgi:hypothetical protein